MIRGSKVTETLLAAAKKVCVQRFVHISAASIVKASDPVRMADENAPIQKARYAPSLMTKALAEEAVLSANCLFRHLDDASPLVWGRGFRLVPLLVEPVNAGRWRWLAGMRFPYCSPTLWHKDSARIDRTIAASVEIYKQDSQYFGNIAATPEELDGNEGTGLVVFEGFQFE